MAAVGAGRQLLFVSIISLILNALCSAILVSVYGYMGAAWGGLIAKYAWTVPVTFLILSRKLDTNVLSLLPWAKLLRTLLLAVVSTIPVYYMRSSLSIDIAFIDLVLSGVVYGAAYLLFLFAVDRSSFSEFKRIIYKK